MPKDETLVQKFSTEALEGDWYMSSSLTLPHHYPYPYPYPNPEPDP